jgi:hypothetical protein
MSLQNSRIEIEPVIGSFASHSELTANRQPLTANR